MLSVRAYGSTHSPFRFPFDGIGGIGTLLVAVDERPGSIDDLPAYPPARPDIIATESGRSSPPNGSVACFWPLYKSGRRGGDFDTAAASRRSLSVSCSLAIACCFLLCFSSPDFDRRKRSPREERRGGCAFEVSGIAASLFSDGGELLELGVLGLVEETIVTDDWIRISLG
jgi:hypothetical protein